MYNKLTKCAVLALVVAAGLLASGNVAFGQFLPGGGVDTPNPNLPPVSPPAAYLTPDDVHAMYSQGALTIVLSAAQHKPFAGGQSHANPDGSETETFDSELDGTVTVLNNGVPLGSGMITLTGPVVVQVFGKVGNVTGTFNTEMLSMTLKGTALGQAVQIRESPTLQSLGQTRITDRGDGLFHIDSFFDVFTELSVPAFGLNNVPSTGPAHVNLVPEPGSIALLGLGLAGCLGVAVRRRKK